MRFYFIILLLITTKTQAYPIVQVDTLIDFSKEDSASLQKELHLLQDILETDAFWESIKNTTFYCTNRRILHHYRKRKGEFPKQKRDRHTYSSQEIHDLLWFGDDEIGEPKDGVINLRLKSEALEPKKKGTVRHGSTNKNTLIIRSHPKTRINHPKKGTYACHLLHEYMHVLGFKHKTNLPSKNTKKCGGVDVPLRIQMIAKAIVKNL